jgi:ComF family protein
MAVNLNIDFRVDKRPDFKHRFNPGSRLCLLCSANLTSVDELLCSACNADLPANLNACPVCALPDSYQRPCAACLNCARPYAQISALYRYEYPVNRLLQQAKFHSRLDIAWFMGRQLAGRFGINRNDLPDCLIPVPLHAGRLAERGYNQALEMANSISCWLDIAVVSNCVQRTIATRAQTELNAKQRQRNVRGAFALNGTLAPEYHHVAIIDDVVTTGATITELARILKKSGIMRVVVWACARALP